MKFTKMRRLIAALGISAFGVMGAVSCMSPSEYVDQEVNKIKDGVNQQIEDVQDQIESAIPTVPSLPTTIPEDVVPCVDYTPPFDGKEC